MTPVVTPVPAPFRLAINGYGRIGRCVLRALHTAPGRPQLAVMAINEPADLASMAYLTEYDSTHGRFPGCVVTGERQLVIADHPIRVTHARGPEEVDWQDIDLVIDCSGVYGRRAELERFLRAGCPGLLLSHPGFSAEDVDATVICERPKVGPHADAMRACVAGDLHLDIDAVSIKATTSERLGFTGRGEGIAAQAVVLLVKA